MHTIGVIAEYNPFHSGHGHHLRMLSQTFGPDCAVVCVMSGNWVQRGDAALADKWTREMCIRDRSRELSNMRREGIIDYHHKWFRILKK